MLVQIQLTASKTKRVRVANLLRVASRVADTT